MRISVTVEVGRPRRPRLARRRVALAAMVVAVLLPVTALASHRFSDVPNSNAFHADIEAIAVDGVTTGCSATLYCPKDFVTREQMAAFLNRLGALAPGKTPVVNADRVDGRDATDLIYVIDNEQPNTVAIAVDWGAFEQVTIDAPSAGFVLVVGSVTVSTVDCTVACTVLGAIELSTTPMGGFPHQQLVILDTIYAPMTMTRVIPVSAGPNTIQVRLRRSMGGNGTISQQLGQISAIYSPFGETHS